MTFLKCSVNGIKYGDTPPAKDKNAKPSKVGLPLLYTVQPAHPNQISVCHHSITQIFRLVTLVPTLCHEHQGVARIECTTMTSIEPASVQSFDWTLAGAMLVNRRPVSIQKF